MRYTLFGIASLALTTACAAQEPLVQVEFCVQDASGVDQLAAILSDFAVEQGLYFSNHGERRARDLARIAEITDTDLRGGTLYFAVSTDDRLLLSASDAGLSNYQVLLGVYDQAENTYDPLMSELRSHWVLVEIPPGGAALPDPECGGFSAEGIVNGTSELGDFKEPED